MKFIDENKVNYIWTIRCDNSETVQDRMSVFFRIGSIVLGGECRSAGNGPARLSVGLPFQGSWG